MLQLALVDELVVVTLRNRKEKGYPSVDTLGLLINLLTRVIFGKCDPKSVVRTFLMIVRARDPKLIGILVCTVYKHSALSQMMEARLLTREISLMVIV
jgi:hypothetical protein